MSEASERAAEYRRLAQEVREIAERIKDAASRKLLREIVDDYEQRASSLDNPKPPADPS